MKSSLLFMGIVLVCSCQSTPEPEQTPSPSNDTTVNATSTPASGSNNALTAAEQAEGWQLLFDGQTKEWMAYL